MEHVSCNLCHSDSYTLLFTLKDSLSLTDEEFRLVSCKQCGLVYLNPRPSLEQLDAFYPKHYWWQPAQTTGGVFLKIAKELEERWRNYLLSAEVNLLKKMLKERSKILDVGCGGGDILYMYKKAGFQAYGVELSPEASRNARVKYGLNVFQGSLTEADFEPDYFDAITFYHAVEHLKDPLLVLKKTYRIIKDTGIVMIQIPNIDSFQFKLFKKHWFGLSVPQHFYHFSPQTIKELLEKTNFKILNIRHISIRCNPAIFVSSLIPRLNPHRFLIEESKGKNQAIAKMIYFILVLMFTPWTLLESILRQGAVITVFAQKRIS